MRSLLRHPNYYKKVLTFCSRSMGMGGKSINFGDKKINNSKFYKNKKLSKIDDIDVDKILVSK